MTLPPRLLGLDFGKKRIGVAATDPLGLMPHPVATIANQGAKRNREALAAICADKDIATIVVGIPVNMDGTHGEAALKAKAFAETLAPLGLPVETIDETLTTVAADDLLKEAGIKDPRERKRRHDEAAACLILRAYMQRERSRAARARAAREAGEEE